MLSRVLSVLLASGVLSVVGSINPVQADLIFDQTINLAVSGRASDFDLPQQSADDFQLDLGSSTITDVHWWGAYFAGNTPTEPDDFTIRFFADAGGPVIIPLAEFAVGDVGRVDTGVNVGGLDVFAYSVDISPLVLTANTTFWLSIVNDTAADLNDDWFWSFDFSGTSAAFRVLDDASWTVTPDRRMGFQLTNDVLEVPEPATWTLFGAGLAGLGWMTRRRKVV